jgi:hypothetical protein
LVVSVAFVAAGSVTAFAVTAVVAPTPISVGSLKPLPVPTAKYHGGVPLSSKSALLPAGGDVAAAPAPALSFPKPSSSFNAATSTVASRSAFDTIFANADGTQTEQSSVLPMNVQKPDGSWVPVSTTVSRDLAGGFSAPDQPLSPTFAPSTGGDGSDYSVTVGGSTVSFNLVGAASSVAASPSSVDLGSQGGSAASGVAYKNVQPGTDLVYQVTNAGVDESLVLAAPPSSVKPSWTWDIHAPGLSLSKGAQDEIDYTDADGVVQLVTPIPAMWDSSGVAGVSGPVITNVPYTLSQLADGDWSFTIAPDAGWLDSADRVYPVFVDPSGLTGPSADENAYESNGTHLTGVTYVGNSRASSENTYWRTVESYDYSRLTVRKSSPPRCSWII